MTNLIDRIYYLLWGAPMLALILGVGVWLTICTRCVQVRLFPQAVRRFFQSGPVSGAACHSYHIHTLVYEIQYGFCNHFPVIAGKYLSDHFAVQMGKFVCENGSEFVFNTS